ncbi:hypothetical protein [Salinispira pacifica]
MKRARSRETGSIAVNLLIIISFLSVAAAGLLVLLDRWFPDAASQRSRLEIRAKLDGMIEESAAHLAADPTPESDSPADPVWDWARSAGGITIEDVSSRIDPNWVRKSLFEKTRLDRLFSPGFEVVGPPGDYLQQLREDHGFSADLAAGYHMLFSPQVLAAYMTPWAYANINVTDEFSLRKLYEIRSGDAAAADTFHTRIQQLLQEKGIVQEKDLRSFLGADFDRLYPAVNALPAWNVHFLPQLILRELLRYPDYGIKNADAKTEQLLALRRSVELSPADLRSVIGLPQEHVIYQYLGTTTWFFRVTASLPGASLTAVLCRLPPDDPALQSTSGAADRTTAQVRFRVVSRRYSP